MIVLVLLSLLGLVFVNWIYMTAIVNYAVQCEMMIDLLQSICQYIKIQLLEDPGQKSDPPTQPMTSTNKVCVLHNLHQWFFCMY